jgi:hypothetical protein
MNYRKVALFSSVLIIALVASILPFSGGAMAVPSGGSPPTGDTSVLNAIEWTNEPAPGLGELANLVVNAEVGIGRYSSTYDRYQIFDGSDAGFIELHHGDTWGQFMYTTSIAFGDVDGDGLDEVGIARYADDGMRWDIRDDADNNFIRLYEGGTDWGDRFWATCIAFGDVDGDGLDEVGIARYADDGMRWDIRDDADNSFIRLHEGGTEWGRRFFATCIAFGDVDGDGLDEVGIARYGPDGMRYRIRDDALADFVELHHGGDGWGSKIYANCIAFGDVDSDGLDEVGITRYADDGMRYRILDDAIADDPFSTLHEESGWNNGFATWIAFGDVDVDGYDEVGITRYAKGGWRCKILDGADGDFGQLASWGAETAENEGWGSDTYATCIAFGDVDFDGLDEIGVTRYRPNQDMPSYWVFDDRSNDFGQLLKGGTGWGDDRYATCIAFGDVDGGSLIVGQPRHSVQTIDDQITVVINAPPKQRYVNFELGKYTATYKSVVENKVVESVKATTGFAFTTSFKGSVGISNIAQATYEFENKVAKKSEREGGSTTAIIIGKIRVADPVDICLGVSTVYDVYEYRVLSPPDKAIVNGKPQFVVITIPQSEPTIIDDNWDYGNHVLGDIRTYPSTHSQLIRYDADHRIWPAFEQNIDGTLLQDSFTVTQSIVDKEKDTSSLKLSVKAGLSIGSGVSGNELSVRGDYEYEEIVTHETTLTEQTYIGIDWVGGLLDPWKYYKVMPVLYYDNEFGYLVLDYVVTEVGKYYKTLALGEDLLPQAATLEEVLHSEWWRTQSLVTTVVVVPDWTVSSCSTTQIPIRIENAEDMESMRITLPYDPAILSPTEVSKGTLTAESSLEWDVGDGTIQIALEDSAGISGTGSIARIGFDVVGSPGDYYTLAPTVSANEGTGQEDESIAVSCGLLRVESVEELRGDCDGDGDIDSVDALLALKMSAGKIEVNLAGDMNDDDQVSPSDAAEMLSIGARKAVIDFYLPLQGIDKGIKPRSEG